MTTDDLEDVEHKRTVLRLKRQALRALEEQDAQFVGYTPGHIKIQIRQVRDDIKLLEQALKLTTHSQDTLEAVGGDALAVKVEYRLKENEDSIGAVKDHLDETDRKLDQADRKIEDIRTTLKRIEERNEDRFAREDRHRRQRQEENDERTTALEQQVEDVSNKVEQVTQTVNQDVLWRWGNRVILVIVAILSVVAVAALILLLGRSFGWW